MNRGALEQLAAVVDRDGEADDVLRSVVSVLASTPGVMWAGIAFLEDGVLVLGPFAGEPDPARRASVAISYAGGPIGELRVDGDVELALLERVAELVSPYVLIGWDTGGEAWEP